MELILEQIEALLKGKEEDIIKMELPPNFKSLDSHMRKDLIQQLGSLYPIEVIDENLFIKIDGGKKEDIHEEVKESLKVQLNGWWVRMKVTCVVNRNSYLPDIGAWSTRPTLEERSHPIANECPPPNVWIEVVINNDKDRNQSLEKFQKLLSQCPNTEFILIVIPDTANPPSANPNPGIQATLATQTQSQPSRAPYLGYWPRQASYNAVQWYKISWNLYFDLSGCGARLLFNTILNQLF